MAAPLQRGLVDWELDRYLKPSASPQIKGNRNATHVILRIRIILHMDINYVSLHVFVDEGVDVVVTCRQTRDVCCIVLWNVTI